MAAKWRENGGCCVALGSSSCVATVPSPPPGWRVITGDGGAGMQARVIAQQLIFLNLAAVLSQPISRRNISAARLATALRLCGSIVRVNWRLCCTRAATAGNGCAAKRRTGGISETVVLAIVAWHIAIFHHAVNI